MAKIKYQAEINHFSEHIDDQAPSKGAIESWNFFLWAIGVGVLFVVLIPLALAGIDRLAHSREVKKDTQAQAASR